MMDIIKQLKITLADVIEGSLAVKSYHWNIEGQSFTSYHEFLADIYEMYISDIDTLGEYIRILSKGTEYVSILSADIAQNKTIDPDILVGDNVKEMIIQCSMINDTLIEHFNTLIELSIKNNEHSLTDYTSSRLNSYKKLAWKLISISKGK